MQGKSSLQITVEATEENCENLEKPLINTQRKYDEIGKKLKQFSSQFHRLAIETMSAGLERCC